MQAGTSASAQDDARRLTCFCCGLCRGLRRSLNISSECASSQCRHEIRLGVDTSPVSRVYCQISLTRGVVCRCGPSWLGFTRRSRSASATGRQRDATDSFLMSHKTLGREPVSTISPSIDCCRTQVSISLSASALGYSAGNVHAGVHERARAY
jgi:hypothetical protein